MKHFAKKFTTTVGGEAFSYSPSKMALRHCGAEFPITKEQLQELNAAYNPDDISAPQRVIAAARKNLIGY